MTGATIKDVAALAGVSAATASRVLSGNPATSPEAREKVRAAVEQLDFRPNAQAQSLRSTRTNTIGLLVSDVRNPFFADLAHAVEQAALAAGARRVQLIEEPIAAAIGAGVAIEEPVGRMVIDVGGGTSEVAVISMGGIVLSRSIRVGGYEMDEALVTYLRGAHQLAIGSRSAEAIKLAIGSAAPAAREDTFAVRGRHVITGLPSEVELHSEEVRDALRAPLREILLAIHETLEQTPPELASDIARDGILLAGGGTLLRGLASLIETETQISTTVAADALTCVAVGSGLALEHYDRLAGGAAGRRARRSRSPTT